MKRIERQMKGTELGQLKKTEGKLNKEMKRMTHRRTEGQMNRQINRRSNKRRDGKERKTT